MGNAKPGNAELLNALSELSRQAGAAILEVYAQAFEVTQKADRSPLTLADMRAHQVIAQGLRQLTPDIPLLSEEDSDIPYDVRRQWTRYWLVDPLDGTKEFVSRNGEFTVNIALIENHAPLLGVVHVPVKRTTYAGEVGRGATRQVESQARMNIRVQVPAPPTLRVVGSRSHGADLSQHLPRLGAHTLLSIGSSLKFCLVAEGSADFYPRFGPTSEWDTGAAQAVVEAAGGKVITADGAPLSYNRKESLLNPNFFVAGDAECLRKLD